MKNNFKKLGAAITVMLLVSVAFVCAVSADNSGTCGDGLTWSVDENNHLTITYDGVGTGVMNNFSGFGPWGTEIESVSFPEGLKTIGSNAFRYCIGLIGPLTFPASLTSIGGCAFEECCGLRGPLTFPAGLTSIGNCAFSNCGSLTGSLTFPTGLTTISEYAFKNCSGLTGPLTFSNGLTTIGNSAFYSCSGLRGPLTFPAGLTSIGNCAFSCCNGLTSVSFPSGLKTIGNEAFGYCSGLTSVSFSDSVSAIGDYAFFNCTGLTGTLTLPSNLKKINKSTFSGCKGITSISFPPDSKLTVIGENAFHDCIGLTGNLILPPTILKIENQAFYGCSGLNGDLILPLKVNTIEVGAFGYCKNLSCVMLPKNIINVKNSSFTGLSAGSIIYTSGDTCLREQTYSVDKTAVAKDNGDNSFTFGLKTSSFSSGFPLTDENAPVKEGDTFLGWYDNPSFSGEKVTSVKNGETLYAKWSSSEPVLVKSISVHGHLMVLTNHSTQYTAKVMPESATEKSVIWSTNKPEVAKVDEKGNVTGVRMGVARIIATAKDGSGISGTHLVIVLPFGITDSSELSDEVKDALRELSDEDWKLLEEEMKEQGLTIDKTTFIDPGLRNDSDTTETEEVSPASGSITDIATTTSAPATTLATTAATTTTAAKSPFPVLGILAGLGAAALFLRRKN